MNRTVSFSALLLVLAILCGCASANIDDYVGGPLDALLVARGDPWMDFEEDALRYVVYRNPLNALGITAAGCDAVVVVRDSVVAERRDTGICNDHVAYPLERVPAAEYADRISGMPLSRVVLSLGAPDRHGSGENDGEYLLIYEFGFLEDPELPFPFPCLVPVTLVDGLVTEIDVRLCSTVEVWPLAPPFAMSTAGP